MSTDALCLAPKIREPNYYKPGFQFLAKDPNGQEIYYRDRLLSSFTEPEPDSQVSSWQASAPAFLRLRLLSSLDSGLATLFVTPERKKIKPLQWRLQAVMLKPFGKPLHRGIEYLRSLPAISQVEFLAYFLIET